MPPWGGPTGKTPGASSRQLKLAVRNQNQTSRVVHTDAHGAQRHDMRSIPPIVVVTVSSPTLLVTQQLATCTVFITVSRDLIVGRVGLSSGTSLGVLVGGCYAVC